MAYSVNWTSRVITIPKADTVFVSDVPDVRSLNVTTFWQTLIDLQDDEVGLPHPDIVLNTPPLTVAGVTLARVIQVINGYTITFEDGLWAVNIIGGNSNLADVVNKNQVSVNTGNSAGYVVDSADAALIARVNDVHAFIVRSLTEATLPSGVKRYTADGGRVMDVDQDAGTRTTTGVSS